MIDDPRNQPDEFQRRWLAQDRKLDQALRINARLWQRTEMAAPRRSLAWRNAGGVLNIVAAALCMLWTGSFIAANLYDWQLALAAIALHAWLVIVVVTTAIELARSKEIDFDAPIVAIQARLESLRAFNLRALRLQLITGIPIWTVPFPLVASESWFGVNLFHVLGSALLLGMFAATVALGAIVVWICGLIARRFAGTAALKHLVRSLSGANLAQAEDHLAQLAAFERGE
jgi:hypothetical protein